jgi:hypothetical protein
MCGRPDAEALISKPFSIDIHGLEKLLGHVCKPSQGVRMVAALKPFFPTSEAFPEIDFPDSPHDSRHDG